MALIGEHWMLVLIGFAGGLVLGLASRVGRFCTLGAVEDLLYGGDATRIRMWGVAIGAAVLLTFGAAQLGAVDLAGSLYLTTRVTIPAAIVGGLMFGFGMAMAGTCGLGALARLGSGELRSFVVVLVLGISAMATMSGPLARFRVALFPNDPGSAESLGIAHAIGARVSVDPHLLGVLAGGAILLAVLATSKGMRSVLWGLPVGAAIASGFVGTTWVLQNGFEPVAIQSHSFAAPLGDSLLYVMLSSGLTPSFGLGSVMGVVAGAVIGSSWKGAFRWEACDDYRELRRQIGGAALMGVGAVIAFGCSIGQGLSAFATLAFVAPITLGAIWIGAVLGLRLLVEGPSMLFRSNP